MCTFAISQLASVSYLSWFFTFIFSGSFPTLSFIDMHFPSCRDLPSAGCPAFPDRPEFQFCASRVDKYLLLRYRSI
ncbi:hypothetical protein V8B97DRAFT_1664672 [Scleroderma yunnanense]